MNENSAKSRLVCSYFLYYTTTNEQSQSVTDKMALNFKQICGKFNTFVDFFVILSYTVSNCGILKLRR